MSLRRAVGHLLGASRRRLALEGLTPALLRPHAASLPLLSPWVEGPRGEAGPGPQRPPAMLLLQQQPFACFATTSGTKGQGGEGPAAGSEGSGEDERAGDAFAEGSFELVELDLGGAAAAGEAGGHTDIDGGDESEREAADGDGGGFGERRRRRRSRSNLDDHYAEKVEHYFPTSVKQKKLAARVLQCLVDVIEKDGRLYDLLFHDLGIDFHEVRVSPDGRQAFVRWSAAEGQEDRAERALGKSARFLRSKLARALPYRRVPSLIFAADYLTADEARLEDAFDRIAREREDDGAEGSQR